MVGDDRVAFGEGFAGGEIEEDAAENEIVRREVEGGGGVIVRAEVDGVLHGEVTEMRDRMESEGRQSDCCSGGGGLRLIGGDGIGIHCSEELVEEKSSRALF